MAVSILPININDAGQVLRFIKSQWNFYKGDKNFVPPMLMDRKKLLNTAKNPFYKHADIQLFVAEKNGQIVGRIGAIINHHHNKAHNDSVGFFGFFECENNQETANALFQVAGTWLKERGMTHVRGPMNPSINDECSLLVDGFDSPPVVLMTYNPPYYIQLIENAGFSGEMDMYAYLLDEENYRSEKMIRLISALRERSKVVIRPLDFKSKEGFKRDVEALHRIYDSAWEDNWGAVKFTKEEFDFLAADLKQIAEPDFTLVAEVNGNIIGFALALPDINQSLIHNKNGGLLGGVWHLLTKKKRINLVRVIALGVLPEYRKSGIETVLYFDIGANARKHNIRYGEASWILANNESMNLGLVQTMKAKRYKTYRVYQKEL